LILGKETLYKEQNIIKEINYFRCFENNKISVPFKNLLERYYIYLSKTSLFFF